MRCVLHAQLSLFKIHITDSLDYRCNCVKYSGIITSRCTNSIVGFVRMSYFNPTINPSDFSVYLYINASSFFGFSDMIKKGSQEPYDHR